MASKSTPSAPQGGKGGVHPSGVGEVKGMHAQGAGRPVGTDGKAKGKQ